jgi:hypothetical protein
VRNSDTGRGIQLNSLKVMLQPHMMSVVNHWPEIQFVNNNCSIAKYTIREGDSFRVCVSLNSSLQTVSLNRFVVEENLPVLYND